VLLSPNDLALRYRFMELLRRHNRVDLTLRELQAIERLTMKIKSDDPEVQDSLRQHLQLSEQLQSRLETLREQLEQALNQGASGLELAQQVYQAGFVLEALKLLDDDPIAVSESRPAQVLRGLLLFEVGRVEEAHSQFEFESAGNVLDWGLPASWTRLAHGDYDNAISLWQQDIELNEQRSLTRLLWTLPMVQSPYQLTGQPSVWPVQHMALVSEVETAWTNELALRLWYTAMCQLETGRPHLAAKTLSGILEVAPETFLRPLIRFYLFVMTDELIDLEPPSEWIPIDGELFAPDPQTVELK
jgi:tetratricopeptide (TPR) repeat protein